VEVVPSVVLIQRVLSDREPGVALVRETNLELQQRIPSDGCYAGAVSDLARRFDPPAAPTVLTGSTSCANGGQRGRTPWVLSDRDGSYFVVPLIEPAWIDVSIPTGDLPEPAEFLSPDPYRAEAVTLTIDRLSHGGLVAGSSDEGQLVYGYDGDVLGPPRGNDRRELLRGDRAVRTTGPCRSLRHLDGRWWAMKEGWCSALPRSIGSTDASSSRTSSGPTQRFLSLKVADAPADLDWSRAVRIDVRDSKRCSPCE
jgi:hypothetical protein